MHTYTYDAEGRLATMNGMNLSFSAIYYADGTEAEGASNGGWTQDYVYDAYDPGGQYVLEPWGNQSGGYDAFELVGLGGRHIAIYNENNPRGTYFVHPNALGSNSNTTDWKGQTNGEQIYDPWGQQLVSGGQAIRFAGMSHRDQTGFDVTPNRDYSNTLGRWLTPDPGGLKVVRLADPQTWNKYVYVRDNPTTLTDPSGLYLMNPGSSTLQSVEEQTAEMSEEAYEQYQQSGGATPPDPDSSTGQSTAQQQDTDQRQQDQQSPQRGLTVGAGVAGNADVGVVGAGAEINGTLAGTASISSSGKPSVGVAATGAMVAYAGDHVAADPKQETKPFVAGGYAGGGVTFFVANTANSKGLSGPFQTISGNVGGGQGASLALSFSHNGTFVIQLTLGPAFGLSGWAVTTNTKAGCAGGSACQ